MTNRGFCLESKVQVPSTADAKTREMFESIQQSMAQIAAPFPEEDVGAGGQ